jgi:hypothetical protein
VRSRHRDAGRDRRDDEEARYTRHDPKLVV